MTQFEVGIGVRDITPEPGVPLWGYGDRTGPATGKLDPLYARAVTFRAGDVTACVVSLDLGRAPVEGSCARIRERARRAGVQHVMLCATHTHHAPVMEFEDLPHVAGIESAIGDAIEASVDALRPACIGVGHAHVDIGHNRRVIGADGRCRMLWRNEDRRPTSPVDREATLIKLETTDGKPLAVLVHFACHPVVMGPSNLEYSADYVGELSRCVKEATGAECVFIQGGSGDINPYLDKTSIQNGGVEAMRGVGREAAQSIIAALPEIETSPPELPSIAFAESSVHVGLRWDFSKPEVWGTFIGSHAWLRDLVKPYSRYLVPELSVPVAALVLNGDVALLGVPGEFFVQYQLDLKATAPVRHALLCGYTNQFHLYFPTMRGAVAGGYGGIVASYVGFGAGDKVLLEGKQLLAELMGATRVTCTSEDFELIEEQ
ncbi:MAG: neutral/alkaline non-lysosomal ceramidase N-terminal domain-containing protein [Candidatus Hydrogenedentes bacterium]|nr:neutral/alkaline non-lysosomal ceramidase N-terminal domain-containing protein [Candidatus Hydrogenedentota bacterium]